MIAIDKSLWNFTCHIIKFHNRHLPSTHGVCTGYANNFTLKTRQKQEEQRQAAIKISSLLLSLQACMSHNEMKSFLKYIATLYLHIFEKNHSNKAESF